MALPPTSTKGSGDSTPVTTFEFDFPNQPITHTGTKATLGALTIAGGGTGQITKAAAFDALSPLSTKGDTIIYSTTNGRQAVPGDYGGLVPDSGATNGWRSATYLQKLQGRPGKNYIQYADFENNATTGWSLGTVGTLTNGLPTGTPTFGSGASGNLSIAATASSIAGAFSLNYVSSAATTQGDMVASSSYAIDAEDQAKVLTIKFYYKAASNPSNCNFSGTSSNSFAWAVWDVTNSAWLTSAGNFNLVQSSGCGYVTGTCQTGATTANIRLVVYNANATSGAATITFDDFYVGPQTAPIGPAMSDWVSDTNFTTSSITGQGTITNMVARSRRSGPDLMVHLTYTSGTTAGTAWTVVLPSIYTINSAAFGTVSQKVGEIKMLETASTQYPSVGEGPWAIFYDGSTTNTLYIAGHTSSNVYTKDNGNQGNSSIPNDVWFTIPVSGWSSNSVASSDTDTRVCSAIIQGSPANAYTGLNPIIFPTITKDTHAAYSVSTGQFTAPITGFYQVNTYLNTNVAANSIFYIYVAGSLYCPIGSNSGSNFPFGGGGQVYATAGQTIDVRCSTSWTVNNSAGALSITRVTGPAVVTATESVNARYYSSSSSVSGSLGTVTFATKDFDSHNAYASGTYTIPVSGKYEVNAGLLITGTIALNNNLVVEIQKNGTVVSRFTEFFPATLTDGKAAFSDLVSCNAGDTIRVQVSSSVTGPSIVSSNFDNYFSIFRQGN